MTTKQSQTSIIDRIWLYLASVKLSIVLLVLLALTSIIGTILPQNGNPHLYEEKFGAMGFKVMDFFGIFNMYHAWWFRLLIILLAVNLLICSLERLPKVLQLIRKKPVLNPGRYASRKNRQTIESEKSVSEIQAVMQENIRVLNQKPVLSEEGEQSLFYAEKGRWTRLGPYVVHIGILFLLMGGLIGSLFGFDGTVSIPEKMATDLIQLEGSTDQIRLPFKIRCDKFSLKFYENGTPDEYRSTLTIIENDKEVLTKDVIVNKPLRYKGISFYQSTYGSTDPKNVKMKIVDKTTNEETEVGVVIGEPIDIPGHNQQVLFTAFRQQFNLRGHVFKNAFLGAILENDTPVEMMILPSDHPGFDKMRSSPFYLDVIDYDHGWYTGLQVKQDPGVWVVYAGFIIMIIGCMISFFMSHRQLGVVVMPASSGCHIVVSGIANKNPLGLTRDIELLTIKITSILNDQRV